MAIGRVGSFATDRPVQDGIGDALKYNEQMGFNYRAEAEKKKEKEDAIKAAKEKDLELPKMETVYTPYASDNAMRLGFGTKSKNTIIEAGNKVRLGKMTAQEFSLIKANVMEGLSLFNQGAKNINEAAAANGVLIKEGKLADGGIKEAMNLGYAYENRNVDFQFNPDGTSNVVTYDEDGTTVLAKEGLEKVGYKLYNPVYKVDFNDELLQFQKTHSMDSTEWISRNQKTGLEEMTPRLKTSISNYADAKLQDKTALTNAYYSATGKFKRDITDEKEIAAAKEYVVGTFEKSYNRKKTAAEAFQGANFGLAKKAAEKDEVKGKEFVSQTDLITDLPKGFVVEKEKYYPNSIGFAENTLKFNNLGGKKSGINNGYVNSFHLEKDGHVIAQVKYLIDKGQKFTLPSGKEVSYNVGMAMYGDETTPQATKDALAPQLNSFTTSATYGETNVIYNGNDPELNSLAVKANYTNKDQLIKKLKRDNQKEILSDRKRKTEKSKDTKNERPKTVTQKGVTYTWNESNQSYE
jgi:hypothetical protein